MVRKMSNEKEPLGLPPGSVRSMIALYFIILGGILIASLVLHGIKIGYDFDIGEILRETIMLIGIIFAFYFGMRSNGSIEYVPKEKIEDMIEESCGDSDG